MYNRDTTILSEVITAYNDKADYTNIYIHIFDSKGNGKVITTSLQHSLTSNEQWMLKWISSIITLYVNEHYDLSYNPLERNEEDE